MVEVLQLPGIFPLIWLDPVAKLAYPMVGISIVSIRSDINKYLWAILITIAFPSEIFTPHTGWFGLVTFDSS